jgi:transcriptional regulator with XRE-family HTH domain
MTTDVMTVSDVIGRQVRAVRRKRDWTQADLAAQCAKLGAPQLSRMVIHDIETGGRAGDRGRRRETSADELCVLAVALHVAPLHLMLPLDDETQVQLAPEITHAAGLVRAWAAGYQAMPGTDRRTYYSWVPDSQIDSYERRMQREQLTAAGEITEEARA